MPFSKKGGEKGEASELFVVAILRRWKKRKKLFVHRRRIIEIIWANKDKELDVRGIDILICFDSGLGLLLQVKTQLNEWIIASHKKRHPHVIYLFGVEDYPRQKVSENLEKLINNALKNHFIPGA